jgi:uncharacterized membrane protein YecN with MAPEG domain
MTLRRFLVALTSASLCMTWLPAGVCFVVARLQHSNRAWGVFASFPRPWFKSALILAVVSLVLCGVSFYRRDFAVGFFALLGSLAVLSTHWRDHFPIY